MDDNHKFLAAFFPLLSRRLCWGKQKRDVHPTKKEVLSYFTTFPARLTTIEMGTPCDSLEGERGGSITVHQRITLSNIRLSPRFSRPFSRRGKNICGEGFFLHIRASLSERESRASDKMWEGQCIMPRNGGRGRKGGRSSEYEKKE